MLSQVEYSMPCKYDRNGLCKNHFKVLWHCCRPNDFPVFSQFGLAQIFQKMRSFENWIIKSFKLTWLVRSIEFAGVSTNWPCVLALANSNNLYCKCSIMPGSKKSKVRAEKKNVNPMSYDLRHSIWKKLRV